MLFFLAALEVMAFVPFSEMQLLPAACHDGVGDCLSDSSTSRMVTSQGGIIRMDTTERVVFLVFTGHEFADGGQIIRETLRREKAQASFFFTGDFYRNKAFGSLIRRLKKDGHYLGGHSDKHLLYVPWSNRDSLLVSHETFLEDLRENYAAMARFGIRKKDARYFLPPFEWYNQTVANWCREEGLTLVNYTPGTSSNADYTYPSLGSRYVSSDLIFSRILSFESTHEAGLNGFILLTHIGTDDRRIDKFYAKLDALIQVLKKRGYSFSSF